MDAIVVATQNNKKNRFCGLVLRPFPRRSEWDVLSFIVSFTNFKKEACDTVVLKEASGPIF